MPDPRARPILAGFRRALRAFRARLRRSLLGPDSYLNFHPYEAEIQSDGHMKKLGAGSMGVAIKGFDTHDGTPVALKIIKTAGQVDETALRRFRREARAALQCKHPNIADVYYFGADPSNYFYAMEYIDGETLKSILSRVGRLPALTALPLMAQLASALVVVHGQRLIHRDLKPANLMVVKDEQGQPQIKLIDFGLVKSLRASASSASISGGFFGSIIYASPEQFPPKEKADEQSDLFSLGVILWHLLAGEPPIPEKEKALMMRAQALDAPPLAKLAGQPPALIRLLASLLEEDPAKRPAGAAAVERAIDAIFLEMAKDSSVQPALSIHEKVTR